MQKLHCYQMGILLLGSTMNLLATCMDALRPCHSWITGICRFSLVLQAQRSSRIAAHNELLRMAAHSKLLVLIPPPVPLLDH